MNSRLAIKVQVTQQKIRTLHNGFCLHIQQRINRDITAMSIFESVKVAASLLSMLGHACYL